MVDSSATDMHRNHFLDFIKGICCIGVILIHVMFPGQFGKLVASLFGCIVPIFFMISGYFAYTNDTTSSIRIKKEIKKILKLTITACLIYLTFKLIFNTADPILLLKEFANIQTWINIIIFNQLEIFGGFHLWFLIAQLMSYLILLFIDKTKTYDIAYEITFVLLIMRIFISVLPYQSPSSWHIMCNFFITGTPWMLLGNYFAYIYNNIASLSNKSLISNLIIGCTITLVCSYLFNINIIKINLSEIGITIMTISLFLLAIKNKNIKINFIIEKIGQKYSVYIYIFHIIIIRIIVKILNNHGMNLTKSHIVIQWSFPILMIICSILFSVFLDRFLKCIKKIVIIKS